MEFRKLFEKDYAGYEVILDSLVKPVFGEKIKPRNQDLNPDSQDESFIKKIKIFATLGGAFPINFVDVTISDNVKLEHNKVRIQRCVRKVTPDLTSALIFFHYENTENTTWRITFVNKGENASDSTNPKRYTYLCGKGLYCRTADERFSVLQSEISSGKKVLDELMINAFNVEALTKEFYNELFAWYEWAVSQAKFPEGKGDKVTLSKTNINTHVIRLITRLMFVWFLKQKSLIPNWIFDAKELENVLSDFDKKTMLSAKKGNYYNAVIQNLFFATLNKAIEERSFASQTKNGERNEQYGIKTLYRDDNEESFFKISHDKIIEMFKTVPFLNGGLFECLDRLETRKVDGYNEQNYLDGFSREGKRRAFVPNCLFWNSVDSEHEGIISILNRFNFTIEESSPSDVTIALDPELLGKVFENLLGVYNPETQESARNDSGSFYTPREIVDYMVDSGIKEYIRGKNIISDEVLESLLSATPDLSQLSAETKNRLIESLSNIKILDPACGSGAFPMGILNRLVNLIAMIDESMNHYTLKLNLIENCIYGIDIQNIAVQISKLRFFISLICEQEADFNKKNFGFDPLPNLETKFVCANSLIGVPQNVSSLFNNEIIELSSELKLNRQKHFSAKTSSEKREYRQKDETLRNSIIEKLLKSSKNNNEDAKKILSDEIAQLKKELANVPELIEEHTEIESDLFGGETKRVIKIDKNQSIKDRLKESIKQKEKALKGLSSSVSLAEDTDTLEKLVAWNPYDQNSSSSFFDSEWMFGVSDGFDIVIGNPPYISTKGVSADDKRKYEAEFGFSDDTYNLFTFKGLDLCKTNGTLNYIIPKTFWTTQTKRNMRDLILSYQINSIFDTADPFEAAMVDTCVIQIQKTEFTNDHKILFRDGSKALAHPITYEPIEQNIYRNTQNSVIFKPTELNMKIYKKYGEKVKDLYDTWWEKIKTSRDIENNKAVLEKYRQSLKPGDIALLGCLTEGGQGLATANNGKYIAVRKSSKWASNIYSSRPKKLAEAMVKKNVKVKGLDNPKDAEAFLNKMTEEEIAVLFDELKDKYGRDIFGQGYIFRLIDDDQIADIDTLSQDEKENGISTKKKYYVPYDKGDKDGNRWYLETPFAIAWSKENVHFLKTNSGKKGEGMPVVRNPQFYFKEGFTWIFTLNENAEYQKSRIKPPSVNDVNAMSLFVYDDISIPPSYYVCLLNSYLVFRYKREFVNSTSAFQINDARQLPIIIPSKEQLERFEDIFNKAVELKKSSSPDSSKELDSIIEMLDKEVYKLYAI
ncbi:MAG: Eco57I restriction-modification methylase domain-containing protein [Spirochaetia bacterium]|nr:Eco57I restriction-modification methylase domain-containing protein [Spirochaetia bacterium]